MQSTKIEHTNTIAVQMKSKSNKTSAEDSVQKMLDVISNNETVRSLLILSGDTSTFLANTIEDFLIVPDNKGNIHKVNKTAKTCSYYPETKLISKDILIIHTEKGSNQSKEISLKPIINEVVKTYQIQAQGKGIEISFHSDDNLPFFWGDKDGLKQIAEDLLKMAIELTNEGKIDIDLNQDNDFLRLNVELPRNGNLQGDETGVSGKVVRGHRHENKGMAKILLVEDDLDITTLLKYDLERAGFEVFTAENDGEVNRHLNDPLPDQIVCNIMMDNIDHIRFRTRIFQDPILSSIPFLYIRT